MATWLPEAIFGWRDPGAIPARIRYVARDHMEEAVGARKRWERDPDMDLNPLLPAAADPDRREGRRAPSATAASPAADSPGARPCAFEGYGRLTRFTATELERA